MSQKVPLVKVGGAQNHHLYKRLDVYWVRCFKVGKGRLEESLKTTILGDARIARDKRIAEFLGNKPRFAGKGVLVEDKFPEFLETKKAKSDGTYQVNETAWRIDIEPGFGGLLLEDLNETAWMLWVIETRKKNPDRKFKVARMVLQNFVNWLNTSSLISRKPKFENVDPETDAGKVYDSDELSALLKKADPVTHLQIRMGCEMMMRHGEIFTLEWWQVNFKKKLIHLPAEKVKTRRSRTFAMSESVHASLFDLSKVKEGQWVFTAKRNKQKRVARSVAQDGWFKCKAAAEVEGRFHDLRHTGLTNAFKHAVNPALICEFAGLSLEEAQSTYLHFTPEDTRTVASLLRLSV